MVKLIDVRIDGSGHLERMPMYEGQKRLSVTVLPRSEWQHTTDYERQQNWLGKYADVYLALFEIPSVDIPSNDEEAIRSLDDTIVDMGDFPHLKAHGVKSLDIRLRRGNVYDIFTMFLSTEGTRGVDNNPRFIAESRRQVPNYLTLEELKFKAIGALGLTPEEAKGLEARVVYRPEERMDYIPRDSILGVAVRLGVPLTLDFDPLQVTPRSVNFLYLKPDGSSTGVYTQLELPGKIQIYVPKEFGTDVTLMGVRQLIGR